MALKDAPPTVFDAREEDRLGARAGPGEEWLLRAAI